MAENQSSDVGDHRWDTPFGRAQFQHRLAERLAPMREGDPELAAQLAVVQHGIGRASGRRRILRARNRRDFGMFAFEQVRRGGLVHDRLRKTMPGRLAGAGHVINARPGRRRLACRVGRLSSTSQGGAGDRQRRGWSSVLVGHDRQRSRSRASRRMVSRKFLPCGAKTQLVRKIRYDPPTAAIACSPASLVLP